MSTGEQCHAVVRPEKLIVSALGNGSGNLPERAQSVQGIVASSIYLGTATQLVVELKGGSRMTVLVPNADNAMEERATSRGGVL